jgi:hypothetical protein
VWYPIWFPPDDRHALVLAVCDAPIHVKNTVF